MITFLFIALVVIALLLVVRIGVHYFYPGWGTTWAGIVGAVSVVLPDVIAGVTGFLGEVQVLPWESILGANHAKAVVFGLAATMVILRNIKRGAK